MNARRLPWHASPHTQSLATSCHDRACATHHRLVDRRAPAQEGQHTLHVPFEAGDEQRRGPVRLPRHTAPTPKPSRRHAWPHHCTDTSGAAHYRKTSRDLKSGMGFIIASRSSPPARAIPAHPTSCKRMHARSLPLARIPAHTAPAMSCHPAYTTHHRLVDGCAPAQQLPNTLHVPVLAGDVQRRGPVRLPRHSTHTNTSRPHAWPRHRIFPMA
jgi:hypothetical protein